MTKTDPFKEVAHRDRLYQKYLVPINLLKKAGVEGIVVHSFKLMPGRILSNRYLIQITVNEIGDKFIDDAALAEFFTELNMPPDQFDQFMRLRIQAEDVGVAFESTGHSANYRAYLAFADGVNPTGLRYIGYKWDVFDNLKAKITEYTAVPVASHKELFDRLAKILWKGPVYRAVTDIIYEALGNCDVEDLSYVEAEESAGSLRNSFDMKLYAGELTLGDIAGEVSDAFLSNGIPRQIYEGIFKDLKEKRLTHLAGGLSSDGKPFLTFYYKR